MEWGLVAIITIILALLVWSLPLFITVKIFGGKTSLLRALGVNILIAVMAITISAVLNFWAGIVIFILTLLLYREMFRLKWWKAVVVWLIQGIIGAVLFGIVTLLGLGVALL
jgi:hypothetical protein